MSRGKLFLFVTLFLQLPNIGASQTLAEFENHVRHSLHKIQAMFDSTRGQTFFDSSKGKMVYRMPKGNYNDSLWNDNAELKKYLLETLPRIPESLTVHIPNDEQYTWFHAATSPDKKFREWSWNTLTGGSRPIIWALYQYKTLNGIKVFDPVDTINEGGGLTCSRCDTIYTIRAKNGTTCYLPIEISKMDSHSWGEGISALRINDTLEMNVPLFQDSTGFISGLSWRNDDAGPPDNETPYRIIVSQNGRTILIPYFAEDNKWKQKIYKFDGEHFIYKGITK